MKKNISDMCECLKSLCRKLKKEVSMNHLMDLVQYLGQTVTVYLLSSWKFVLYNPQGKKCFQPISMAHYKYYWECPRKMNIL
ncbi:hypothetical protein Avbf_13588 [Armadillidium vulgare]|nr:hypothetical protein Avbf_13588 [Armadillidium vulgare]